MTLAKRLGAAAVLLAPLVAGYALATRPDGADEDLARTAIGARLVSRKDSDLASVVTRESVYRLDGAALKATADRIERDLKPPRWSRMDGSKGVGFLSGGESPLDDLASRFRPLRRLRPYRFWSVILKPAPGGVELRLRRSVPRE